MGHIGDSSSDTAQVAMGYSPPPDKPASGQPWSYPVDAVFIRRFESLSLTQCWVAIDTHYLTLCVHTQLILLCVISRSVCLSIPALMAASSVSYITKVLYSF